MSQVEITELTPENFEQTLASYLLPVVVFYHHVQNARSRAIFEAIEELAPLYAGRATFGWVDTCAHPNMPYRYNSQISGGLTIYVNSAVKERYTCALPKDKLNSIFKASL